MGRLKDYSFDLSNTMSEDEMVEFGFELDRYNEQQYFDSLALTYELV